MDFAFLIVEINLANHSPISIFKSCPLRKLKNPPLLKESQLKLLKLTKKKM